MRFGTYSAGSEQRAGVFVDGGVIDVQRVSGLPVSLLGLLQQPDWQPRLQDAIAGADVDRALDEIRIHTPLARPGKILAAAGNYQEHIDEGGGEKVDVRRRTPRVFIKPSTSLVGPEEPVVLPSVSEEVDWELELAVVIGTGGRDIPADGALDHVAGYTILNDISARTMSWGLADREVHAWDGFFDWLVGKWIDTFAPTGPWIVTADEIPDPQALRLTLELNGEVWQDASTAGMIFDCAELIAFISRFTRLEPGDIIATGTPAGVGVARGRYLREGDVLVGTIEGIGALRTPVVAP